LFPTVVFLLAWSAVREPARRPTHITVAVFCGITFLTWGVITISVELFGQATTEVTDTENYLDVLDEVRKSYGELVVHFPPSIPSDAQSVSFSFLPAFLQGGMHFQLRCSLPVRTISELYDRFSAQTTKVSIGDSTPLFYTGGADHINFPDDFEIMVFDEADENNRPANHGQGHGVAISRQRNEIVYWAETWK
jgi:hypothetical protein